MPILGLRPHAPSAKRPRRSFTSTQRRLLAVLAAVVALRMLGLALVLPVMTLYALEFTSSRLLAGLAFGSYGLTMALLQIPFGRLSDRVGRRRVLLLGMTLFGLGSLACATPGWFPPGAQIGILILGRLLQGGGAVISVAFACVADHIEPDRRATAMAALGIPIGGAFIVGVIVGPVLAGRFGSSVLFWLTGVLGLATLPLIRRFLPDGPARAPLAVPMSVALRSPGLLDLAVAGFLMNFAMGSFFYYFPLIATGRHHLPLSAYYRLLVPMTVISAFTMLAFSRGADRGRARALSAIAFALFTPAALLLFKPESVGFDTSRLTSMIIAGVLFYVGFTGLEPMLPSLVSRVAREGAAGAALGLYNSLQFLGSFAGGAIGGALAARAPVYMIGLLVVTSLVGGRLVLRGPSP
jgi:MFS family permease